MQLKYKLRGSGESRVIGMTHTPTMKLHPLTMEDIEKVIADAKKYGPRASEYEIPHTIIMEDHPDAVPRPPK